jgi:hypothetical protein
MNVPVRLVLVLLVLSFLAFPRPVLAASARAEAAALDALNKAEGDYLGMNYASGAARLDKALRACAPANCSPGTQAALMRDIGTMEFRAGDKGFAAKAFSEALKLQPTIDLNPSYDSPDLRAAWNEVKGVPPPPAAAVPGTSAAPAAPAAPASPGPSAGPGAPAVAPPPTFPQPTGDFTHTPAAEQKIDTPLPIYLEGGPSGVYHVIVRYKHSEESDESEWNHTDLAHVGKGWGGLLPCNAIVAGTMRYYVQAYNKDMDPVGANGDAKNPYQVPIREELAGPPPHLPNKNPPKACHQAGKPKPEAPTPKQEGEETAAADCPPGVPGCGKAEKGDTEEEGKGEDKDKAESKEPLRRWWIGAGLHFDFAQMPQGTDLCHLNPNPGPTQAQPANDKHIYCYATDVQSDFPPRTPQGQIVNDQLQKGFAGNSAGGIVPGNLRVFASLDYALTANFLVGVRGGYVLLRYPSTLAANDGYAFGSGVYVEARFTAVIGKDALKKDGFSPILFAGGGVSAFDAHTSDTATLCGMMTSTSCNGVNPRPVKVDLWYTNGPGFITAGGGVRYAPTARFALIGALRVNLSFGNNGAIPTLGPEVGGQVGF